MTIYTDDEMYWLIKAYNKKLLDLREQVKMIQEALGNAVEATDYLHRACMDPSRSRQAIGEMASHLLNTLNAILEQTKPKDSKEVKL